MLQAQKQTSPPTRRTFFKLAGAGLLAGAIGLKPKAGRADIPPSNETDTSQSDIQPTNQEKNIALAMVATLVGIFFGVPLLLDRFFQLRQNRKNANSQTNLPSQ